MTPAAEAIALAIPLLVRFEGVRLRPYLCSAGVPTIGIGATRYLDGRRVTLSDQTITREAALVLLRESVAKEYLPAVLRLCPGADTPQRVAAITSFAYNCGISSLRASTFRRRVNAMDWGRAKEELLRWNKAGGRVVTGLSRRRAIEASLL